MTYNTTKPGEYQENPKNTKDEFFGNAWSIKTIDSRYYLHYISGSMQGEHKSVEISEEDSELMKNGKLSFDDACIRYGVH